MTSYLFLKMLHEYTQKTIERNVYHITIGSLWMVQV